MILRLALAVVMALTGTGATHVVRPLAPVVHDAVADPAPEGAADGTSAPADEVEVVGVDVVVPAVDATGAVVATDEVREGQADPDVLVADAVTSDGAAERVVTEVLETDGFQTLGVTWPAEADAVGLAVEVRTRTDGVWGDWASLEAADDGPDVGTPDVGTPDAENAGRGGTDSLWVGPSDAVQVSFAATPTAGPSDVELVLIDVPEVDGDLTGTVAEVGAGGAASVTTAAYLTGVSTSTTTPRVISRSDWGARAQVCTPSVASRLVGAVLHHTAGRNTYATVGEAMQQIRGDQAYHIDGRQWCDIGYNFVVDKWGNIYEGRAHSLTRPVIGVHAGGFNTATLGISMLGTYDAAPSVVQQQAVALIVGWRLGAYGVDPESSMSYFTYGGQNSKIPANTAITLPRVFGHRDVAYTSCPGNGGYAALPGIRAAAADYSFDERFRQAYAVVTALYADILGRGVDPTGLATWSTRLATGTSQSALVNELTRSDEYIALRVAKAYREVLGREPEAQGAANWLVQIRLGRATVDDVQRRFFDSQEFVNRSGGTIEGYVAAMYRAILGRDASAAEIAAWTAKVDSHGRGWVVDQIWFSREAAANRAGTYYRVFLQREPDAAGLAGWAIELLTRGEGAVRTGIAGSEEYRLKALVRYPDTGAART